MEDKNNKNESLADRLVKALEVFLLAFLILGGLFLFQTFNDHEYEENINYSEGEEKSEKESNKEENKEEDSFKLEEPKEFKFNWNYNKENYSLDLVLYNSLYNYYSGLPKEHTCIGTCPEGWEEDYYNMFLNIKKEDNTFSKLASDLEKIEKENNLTDDQTLELTISFVQAIPYDEEGAEGEIPLARYPYQVLYEKKGLCSGKSFLGALLVKELDYGVALFSFDKANHMVIGIKCPKEVSSYNSGYCYTELTTPGWKIGIEDFDDIENINSTSRTPSINEEPKIYVIKDGKTYNGIYKTIEEKERIKNLKKEIDQLNYEIRNLKEDLDYYKRIGDYDSYNSLVDEYNNLVSEHSTKIKTYNKLIKEFSPGV